MRKKEIKNYFSTTFTTYLQHPIKQPRWRITLHHVTWRTSCHLMATGAYSTGTQAKSHNQNVLVLFSLFTTTEKIYTVSRSSQLFQLKQNSLQFLLVCTTTARTNEECKSSQFGGNKGLRKRANGFPNMVMQLLFFTDFFVFTFNLYRSVACTSILLMSERWGIITIYNAPPPPLLSQRKWKANAPLSRTWDRPGGRALRRVGWNWKGCRFTSPDNDSPSAFNSCSPQEIRGAGEIRSSIG